MRNLWEIGFKRDELKARIAEVKGNKEKEEPLMILYDELGKDAITRKESIDAFYKKETQTTYAGLLATMFFVLSLSFGVYGISATFHTELLDPFTYYTPVVCLFAGVVTTVFALLSSSFRIVKSLEIR